MLAELEDAQNLFDSVAGEINKAADNFAKAAGMSLTKQEQRVADYLTKVYARAAALDALEEQHLRPHVHAGED